MEATTELRELEGWLTVQQAADRLGIARQSVHKMIQTGRIENARRVGSQQGRSATTVVVSVADVERLEAERRAKADYV